MLLFFLLEPLFYSVLSKNAKFKEAQKRKPDTICEHTCANCSCQNVRSFFCKFQFCCFGGISMFFRDGFDRFPKIKLCFCIILRMSKMRFSKRKLHFLFLSFLSWRNRNRKKKNKQNGKGPKTL